jgi:hypothetical protein
VALGIVGWMGVGIVAGFFLAVFVLTVGENVTSLPISTLPSNLAPATEFGAYNGASFAVIGVGQLLASTVGGFALAAIPNPLLRWGLLSLPALPAACWSRSSSPPGFARARTGPERARTGVAVSARSLKRPRAGPYIERET